MDEWKIPLYKIYSDDEDLNLISKIKGKCLVVGVGKSYLVGLNLAATLSSLGTPSVAFAANDLQHGGMGAIQKGHDLLLVFSVSGESSELNSILKFKLVLIL